MSSKARSPTAHILRNSRLFSLPRPLPSPYNSLYGEAQSQRMSETTTLPYPIQQAIVTPPTALHRGEWGLKRSLPLRTTTKSSTPILRINAIDTREQITDFDSAADLTISLRKIQELGLPVTVDTQKYATSTRHRQISAFEEQFDNTDRKKGGVDVRGTAEESWAADPKKRRWKTKGPWVAGMSPGEFATFVKKTLKKRKPEFTAFLRERARRQLLQDRRAEALTDGDDVEDTIPEEDIDAHIRMMRDNYDLDSPLARLIAEFLDLPDLPNAHTLGGSFLDKYKALEDGPPSTHPSAGVSYLRSDAILDNHPLLGPQADHIPAEARVLGSRNRFETGASVGVNSPGVIGVAGVVSPSPSGSGNRVRSIPALPDRNNPQEVTDRNAFTIGLATPGGNRIWVSPTKLEVDQEGRVHFGTVNPSPVAVGIHHTGDLHTPNLPRAPSRDRMGQLGPMSTRPVPEIRPNKSDRRRESNRYGLGNQNIGPDRGFDGTGEIMEMLSRDISRETARRRNASGRDP